MQAMMRPLTQALRSVLEPGPAPVLFVLGVVALGLITNAMYDALKASLGPFSIIVVAALLLAALVIVAWLWRKLVRPKLKVSEMRPRRGLVALVSKGQLTDIPAATAIDYHYQDGHGPLQYCWLITSAKPPEEGPIPSAWQNAQGLKSKYQGRLRAIEVIEIKETFPDDPEGVFKATETAFNRARRRRLRRKEIVADITGGTKLMTTGMVLACTALNGEVEYLMPLGLTADGRADASKGAVPKRVDLSFFVGRPEEGE